MKKSIINEPLNFVPKSSKRPLIGNHYKSLRKITRQKKKLQPIKLGSLVDITEKCYKNLPWDFTGDNNKTSVSIKSEKIDSHFVRTERNKSDQLLIRNYNQDNVENSYRNIKAIRFNFRCALKGNDCDKELETISYRIVSDLGSNGSMINDSRFLKFAENRFRKKKELMENLENQHRESTEMKRLRHEKMILQRHMMLEKSLSKQRLLKLKPSQTSVKDPNECPDYEIKNTKFEIYSEDKSVKSLPCRSSEEKLYKEFLDEKECYDETRLTNLFTEAQCFIVHKLYKKSDSELCKSLQRKKTECTPETANQMVPRPRSSMLQSIKLIRSKSQKLIDFLTVKSKTPS